MLFEAAQERVARGVALLDVRMPDWRSKINLETLSLSSAHECVLGQVFRAEHKEHVAQLRASSPRHWDSFGNGYWYGCAVLMIADTSMPVNTLTEAEEAGHSDWSTRHGFVAGAVNEINVGYRTLASAWQSVLSPIAIGDKYACIESGLVTVTQVHPDGAVEATDDLGFYTIYSASEAAARVADGRWSLPSVSFIAAGGRRFEISE